MNIAICDDEKAVRKYVFEVFDVAAFCYLLKLIEEDKFRDVFRREERDEEMKSAESVRFVRSAYKTDNEKNGWSR